MLRVNLTDFIPYCFSYAEAQYLLLAVKCIFIFVPVNLIAHSLDTSQGQP